VLKPALAFVSAYENRLVSTGSSSIGLLTGMMSDFRDFSLFGLPNLLCAGSDDWGPSDFLPAPLRTGVARSALSASIAALPAEAAEPVEAAGAASAALADGSGRALSAELEAFSVARAGISVRGDSSFVAARFSFVIVLFAEECSFSEVLADAGAVSWLDSDSSLFE